MRYERECARSIYDMCSCTNAIDLQGLKITAAVTTTTTATYHASSSEFLR